MQNRGHEVPFMPTNRLIYAGILLVAASALIWLGAYLAVRVEWIVPYVLVLGVLLIFAGLIVEARRRKDANLGDTSEPL
jgi:4-hydroxybenzoate polyprenyltransferase